MRAFAALGLVFLPRDVMHLRHWPCVCLSVCLSVCHISVFQGCSTGYLHWYWYLELKYWYLYLYLRHGYYWYWYLRLKYWYLND